jgi:hypothetical protein
VKFVPFSGNMDIVTSGVCGDIRLTKLSPAGIVNPPETIINHSDFVTGVGFYCDSPNNILSVGLDGRLLDTDIRQKKSIALFDVIKD